MHRNKLHKPQISASITIMEIRIFKKPVLKRFLIQGCKQICVRLGDKVAGWLHGCFYFS